MKKSHSHVDQVSYELELQRTIEENRDSSLRWQGQLRGYS